jgi:phosphoesterase RecJ-like protein
MQAVAQLLTSHERIVLVSHVRPDGDAVGSLLALAYGLKSIGKEVIPVLTDGVPSVFKFLTDFGITPVQQLPPPTINSILIVLDAADATRTGDKETTRKYLERGQLAVIDHHPTGDLEGKAVGYEHRLKASSTCEIVYSILLETGCRITPQIATCLYTGMYTDTSAFKHSTTTELTLQLAAELLKRGANLRKIVDEISQQKTVARLKLIGLAMQRVSLNADKTIAYSVITQADIIGNGAMTDDLLGIVNQVSLLPDVNFFAMLIEESPGVIRVSLRVPESSPKKKISVGKLAKLLGGGGHPSAAGFQVTGKVVEMKGDTSWQIV